LEKRKKRKKLLKKKKKKEICGFLVRSTSLERLALLAFILHFLFLLLFSSHQIRETAQLTTTVRSVKKTTEAGLPDGLFTFQKS
jgi:predicted house-cleaning noncanonical NTP pyrophosphatase (MazG superfamily)